jgi:Domain of unknown function (DUF1772)
MSKLSFSHLSLLLLVVAVGILLGGGLYETLVVMPIWTANIPDSVIAYYRHNAANPALAMNPGGRFWLFITPMVGLLAIATLATSFKTDPTHRKWRILGSGLTLATVIFTFVWFVPNIIKLSSAAVLTMDLRDTESLANWWVKLNWLRAILYSIAWLASLWALTLSPIPAKRTSTSD